MFSRPVSSGWKPVPTSNKLATRPLMLIFPVVGVVTRERIFNSVDLPAPFFPMIPKTSPFSTEKEILLLIKINIRSTRHYNSLFCSVIAHNLSIKIQSCIHFYTTGLFCQLINLVYIKQGFLSI